MFARGLNIKTCKQIKSFVENENVGTFQYAVTIPNDYVFLCLCAYAFVLNVGEIVLSVEFIV